MCPFYAKSGANEIYKMKLYISIFFVHYQTIPLISVIFDKEWYIFLEQGEMD
jgi:hypothetical protein